MTEIQNSKQVAFDLILDLHIGIYLAQFTNHKHHLILKLGQINSNMQI